MEIILYSMKPHNNIKQSTCLTSIYSIPPGSLLLPIYRTNSGKSAMKYIYSNIWNSTLKDLSKTYIEKYTLDPFWIGWTKPIQQPSNTYWKSISWNVIDHTTSGNYSTTYKRHTTFSLFFFFFMKFVLG